MTILEAGIIAGAAVGAVIGGAVGRSHGPLAATGCAAGGMILGAAAGAVFAFVLMGLLSVVGVFWRAVQRRSGDPLGEADIACMTPVAILGVFLSAVAGTFAWMTSDWLRALLILMLSSVVTAVLAVAKCELGRAE